MRVVLDAADWYGRYENERVRFNVDQNFIAEQTGIPQQTVSRILSELIDEGWLIRKGDYVPPRKGRPGKSYLYELPKEVPHEVNSTNVEVADGATFAQAVSRTSR
jgi:DNA-binding Lrp family transcriptional regulator